MSAFMVPARRRGSKVERDRQRRLDARAARQLLARRLVDEALRKFPQIFEKVRSPGWPSWYESVTGRAWDPNECAVLERFDDADSLERERVSARTDRAWYAAEVLPQTKGLERLRIIMLLRTPRWVKRAELAAAYAERARLSEMTGLVHVVEHIVPLEGPDACGLNVPWNLRIVPVQKKTSGKLLGEKLETQSAAL